MARVSKSKMKAIEGLIDRGTWIVTLKDDTRRNADLVSSRFDLTVKNLEADQPIYKARLIAQVHRPKDNHCLLHNSSTLRNSPIRIISLIAPTHSWRIWNHDVTQAYPQSTEKLLRKLYLKKVPGLELTSKELPELLKPLYGLPD